jgi:hypothetical protein
MLKNIYINAFKGNMNKTNKELKKYLYSVTQ